MTSAAVQTWTQSAAVVVGQADDPACRRVTALLRAAGFGVGTSVLDAGLPDAPAGTSELIVLLSPGNDATRGRAIRTVADSQPDAKILLVMPGGTPHASLRRALLAGASGIVLEADVERALVSSARAILAGQVAVPGVLARVIAPRPLSHREKQILGLVVSGATNREIAHKLFLAESTVKTHLSSAFRKLDAHSRADAVARIQDPETGYGLGILAVADQALA